MYAAAHFQQADCGSPVVLDGGDRVSVPAVFLQSEGIAGSAVSIGTIAGLD